MRLRELRDTFLNQDIYVVGTGPSVNAFPLDFLEDKICLSLNDAYKIHPAISPIAFMHHQLYAHAGNSVEAPYHDHLMNIRYPIVKATGRVGDEIFDWDHPYFYYCTWRNDIENIWTVTKETDELFYTPEGCCLHGALMLCWIMGARNIFVIGCDSRTMGGRHYAEYDKNKFRDDEVLKRGKHRNYDSYVYGTLIYQEFLRRKGINVVNLSPIVGYHRVDYQYDVLRGQIPIEAVVQDALAKEAVTA
jgi:hypothetical protein